MRAAFAVAVVACIIGCAGSKPAPSPRPGLTQSAAPVGPFVSSQEAHRLVEHGALLLDVRSKEEYDAGHVAGAVNLPVEELPSRLQELPAPPKQVVVYCHTGRRAAKAAGILAQKGYDVSNLGPMSAWAK